MSRQAQYEELQLIAAVGGLANREVPCLFVLAYDADAYWLQRLSSSGAWLSGADLSPVRQPSAEALLTAAATCGPGGDAPWKGVVLYDPAVPPTSLLAETAAGQQQLLPIAHRPGDPTSLFSRIVSGGPRLPVVRSMLGVCNGSVTGSVKRDCYDWAVANMLRPVADSAAPAVLGYYVDYWAALHDPAGGDGWDKSTVLNHDWVIARGGFFFDLSAWSDEAPVDEPGQPLGSDAKALRAVLAAANNASNGWPVHMAGFTPWAYKYTSVSGGKHQGVATEWETVRLLSAFTAFADADACCVGNMANAALFQHYPLPRNVPLAPAPSLSSLQKAGALNASGKTPDGVMVYFVYMGDFDSAAWAYSQLVPEHWDNAARGTRPLGWAVDPGLMPRFPPVFDVLTSEMAAGDALVTGDSGANYINPTMLFQANRAGFSGLGDAWVSWLAWSEPLFDALKVRQTGFVISGDAPPLAGPGAAKLAGFSPNGAVVQSYAQGGPLLDPTGRMPMMAHTDLPRGVPASAAAVPIVQTLPHASGPATFHMFRSILTAADWAAEVVGNASSLTSGRAIALDPVAVGYAARSHLSPKGPAANSDLPTILNETLPLSLPAALPGTVAFVVTVRNDGWVPLPSGYVLTASAALYKAPPARPVPAGSVTVPFPEAGIAPHDAAALPCSLPLAPPVPAAPGDALVVELAVTKENGQLVPGIPPSPRVVPVL